MVTRALSVTTAGEQPGWAAGDHNAAHDFDAALPIVITGHVDHGKSTVTGRLLADTHSLPVGKLESVREYCERNARPFEYAFLLDALKEEQAQGVTIDAARVFFHSARRRYLVIDAPGHVEFLKNMVTGASRADAALLVIDAHEGIRENSRRHGYLLSMLGIRQVAVVVNKMDLVGYRRDVFDRISSEFREYLARFAVNPAHVIPASGLCGDNLAARSDRMAWYEGPTVLETLDGFVPSAAPLDRAFRMPVQGVYKFTARNDDRRIVAGTVETGRLRVGDEVVFYPSGKRSRVRSIEAFSRPAATEVRAGEATGFTLEEQIFVTRGELAARVGDEPPVSSTRLLVSLFWLGRRPMTLEREYTLKIGTTRVGVKLEAIHHVMDASELVATESPDQVRRHDIAECTLVTSKVLAFDPIADLEATGRFAIVDDFDICGGGIIRKALTDQHREVRDAVLRRNLKWTSSLVAPERRSERLAQRPTLVLITGDASTARKELARHSEASLFEDGRFVYGLTMGNVVYGVDADLERTTSDRPEHIRRFAEIANILLDAGMILVASAAGVTEHELETIRTAVGPDQVASVWIGDGPPDEFAADLVISESDARDHGAARVKALLQDRGAIFRC
jgi:bifunctional enzyme CysN/CysC